MLRQFGYWLSIRKHTKVERILIEFLKLEIVTLFFFFYRSSVGKDLGCNRDVQLLPNVLALVRFWYDEFRPSHNVKFQSSFDGHWYRCQYRTSPCIFDLSLILSYVGPPNNSLSLPAYYVFEWAQAWTPSFSSNDFQCPKQSTNFSDSCYRVSHFSIFASS